MCLFQGLNLALGPHGAARTGFTQTAHHRAVRWLLHGLLDLDRGSGWWVFNRLQPA